MQLEIKKATTMSSKDPIIFMSSLSTEKKNTKNDKTETSFLNSKVTSGLPGMMFPSLCL